MRKLVTKSFYLLAVLSIIFLIAVGSSEYLSYSKTESLQRAKALSTAVYNLGRADLDLANIQYRGQNALLRHENDLLQQHYTNDYISTFFETVDQRQELSKLKQKTSSFNVAAGEWYTLKKIDDDQLKVNRERFTVTYNTLSAQIAYLAAGNKANDTKRHTLFITFGIPLLLLTFISGSLVRRRNRERNKEMFSSKKDVQRSEYPVQSGQNLEQMEHTIKSPKNVNSAYLDELTGINNDKGFLHEYNDNKGKHLSNYTAVCLFAIDKLDELETNYPPDFSESILKKVSFMLALYHHDHDVIGRIEHNSFVIILSRIDKPSAINDCELIRKSMEGTSFTTEGGQTLSITISGGFVQKDVTQNISEILKKANRVLAMSIQHGGNRIAQLRDKNAALK